jgi:hypothetical protein
MQESCRWSFLGHKYTPMAQFLHKEFVIVCIMPLFRVFVLNDTCLPQVSSTYFSVTRYHMARP